MGATLRVDPRRLRTAAESQAAASTFVSGMGARPVNGEPATGMSGLLGEAACGPTIAVSHTRFSVAAQRLASAHAVRLVDRPRLEAFVLSSD
jgi:hypothetical protein